LSDLSIKSLTSLSISAAKKPEKKPFLEGGGGEELIKRSPSAAIPRREEGEIRDPKGGSTRLTGFSAVNA